MRITFVCPNLDLSGGSRVLATYATRLSNRGHEVVVVSVEPPWPPWPRRLARWLRGQGRPGGAPGPSHFDGLDVDLRRAGPADRCGPATLPDADVVIATWWQTAEWLENAPAAKGVKVLFAQGYETYEWMPADRIKRVWRLPFHKIVVARWLKELASREFGDDHASLVPNAVDLRQFDVPERVKPARPTVGVVYSPARFRGCDIVFEAIAQARRRLPDLRVLAFGSHPLSERLPLPPDTEFAFMPSQEAITRIYAACTAWLFGSRQEGFGLPILEAMACRAPVIATPGGAAPELLSAGGGFLVPHDDPAAMAEKIIQLCELDTTGWRRLSREAYSIAAAYTWDDAAAGFEAALTQALGQAAGARGANLG
jgi:glycosyltransferase involved in cell wall biosynthesis